MANAVEEALNRASAEQREQAQKVIEEARANIRLVSLQQPGEMTPSVEKAVNDNLKIIEDAKRSIPYDTMQSVDAISPPLPTPATHSNFNATVVEINSTFKSSIESIEQGDGNNYLRDNAVDRAMARPTQEIQQEPERQQAMGR